MTLRHMLIFRTVCEMGANATKAAEKLHMTQPAVSLALKELEQYYGTRLFDRLGRRLQLTDAGRRFLQYAVDISDLFADMETGLRDWDSSGVLRVGASITVGSRFMPDYVREFSRICPGTEVRVTVEQTERLKKKILDNELDFALVEGVIHDPNLVSEAFLEDHLSVVCPADGAWRQGQVIPAEEFRKQRFLLRERGSGTREVFEHVIGQAGFTVSPIWESMSTTALINGVIKGIGIAVLPRRMVADAVERGEVVTVAVEGLQFRRDLCIIYHKDKFLTRSARQFMDLCRRSAAPPENTARG